MLMLRFEGINRIEIRRSYMAYKMELYSCFSLSGCVPRLIYCNAVRRHLVYSKGHGFDSRSLDSLTVEVRNEATFRLSQQGFQRLFMSFVAPQAGLYKTGLHIRVARMACIFMEPDQACS
jgi:hypothetical protein